MKRLVALSLIAFATVKATAEPPRVSFGPGAPDAFTEKLERQSRELWRKWESELGVSVVAPELSVAFVSPTSVSGLAGRSIGQKIEINDRLGSSDTEHVFAHELAHVFLQSKCPAASPLYAETFAQWMSRDDQRLISSSGNSKDDRFVYASEAARYLSPRIGAEGGAQAFHDGETARALARLIAESRRLRPEAPTTHFAEEIRECGLNDARLAKMIFGSDLQSPLSKESVLVVDGITSEILLARGDLRKDLPIASLLKPYFVATMPKTRQSRVAKASASWNCPVARAGKTWTWQEGLAGSCNGFFLDTDAPSADEWSQWRGSLARFGVNVASDPSIARAIGLVPGIEANVETTVAMYRWLSLANPDVIDALEATARSGTLARLSDSSWFIANRIALKSGTIRNAKLDPEHGWLAAVGPRSSDGFPAFVAVIHQRGSSPQMLLPRLRSHLQDTVGRRISAPRAARVQILGLAPRAALTARCDGAWLKWNQGEKAPQVLASGPVEAGRLEPNEARACASGPIRVRYPAKNGFEERSYWGRISLQPRTGSLADAESAEDEKRARARAGSELMLETSETSYLAGVLASESPNSRAEALKALALVAKFNARHSRHAGRPICDTTHCQVFGPRNADSAARPGSRLYAVARDIASESLVSDDLNWLPFSLGGSKPWERVVAFAEIGRRLKLAQEAHFVTKVEAGIEIKMGKEGAGLARVFSCEKFRNALRLPSCPETLAREADGLRVTGRGEGHGLGLDLARAEILAAEGRSHREILRLFFPSVRLVSDEPTLAKND